jgi:hypothetical protein
MSNAILVTRQASGSAKIDPLMAPKARMGVSFLIGPDGKASEVTIEDLNEYGIGRLTRVITK